MPPQFGCSDTNKTSQILRTDYHNITEQPCTVLVPCRFCTRMSLICPMNSSRSNQSSRPCPAIRRNCRNPGPDRGGADAAAAAVCCPAGRQGSMKPGAARRIDSELRHAAAHCGFFRHSAALRAMEPREEEEGAAAPGWCFRGGMELIQSPPSSYSSSSCTPSPLLTHMPTHTRVEAGLYQCNLWKYFHFLSQPFIIVTKVKTIL